MSSHRDSTGLGSARVPRVGERVLAIANFSLNTPRPARMNLKGKFVAARRRNQHARGVRYPTTLIHAL
jgi:hypothetical protein